MSNFIHSIQVKLKKVKMDTLIVLGISGVTVILGLIFVIKEMGNNEPITQGDMVIVSETGEASYLNMEVPSMVNSTYDSTSITDKYVRYKVDSLNRLKTTNPNMGQIVDETPFSSFGNSRLHRGREIETNSMNPNKTNDFMDYDNSYSSNSSSGYSNRRNIETIIAQEQGESSPRIKTASKPKRSTHNVYGDESMWDLDSPKGEGTSEPVETVYEQKQVASTSKTSVRQRGEKKTFDDLTPVEKRNILRITKTTEYEETAEISASIFSRGKVKSGDEVTFITNTDAVLNFKIIPRGTLVTAKVQISDRMYFRIPTIKIKKEFVKVNLSVYSNDGLEGIPYDGGESITEETQQEGIDEALSSSGRIGRIVKGITKATRKKKQISVDLGLDIPCYLINENVEL